MANKRGIASELILTLGFVILMAMVLVASTIVTGRILAPVAASTPQFIAFDVARSADAVLAAPETVSLYSGYGENYEFRTDGLSKGINIDTGRGSIAKIIVKRYTGPIRQLISQESPPTTFYKDDSISPNHELQNAKDTIILTKSYVPNNILFDIIKGVL